MSDNFFHFISLGLNATVLIAVVRLIRSYSRVELKVDTIWEWFIKSRGSQR